MKVSTMLAVFSAATFVSAQGDTASLPACAESCIQDGLSTSSCDPNDFTCQCSDVIALTAVMNCVKSSCDPSQYSTIIEAASAICAEYGGTRVPEILSSALGPMAPTSVSEISSRTTANVASNSETTMKVSKTASQADGITSTGGTLEPTSTEAPNTGSKAIMGGISFFMVLANILAAL
ncbi:hypothetical protein H072_1078 [Dactylellina haptotyla CBS 200.50]|uniref:CFEM domain-containing protein n=1 Tax=Dactylellina haptotyla (strain CBS 200.50) TaxID=1284197 RepID=S8BZR4_DACHA|nr:hypothetical protein H072_1078 [Dactylellina haptotyla CBS 200.50]